MTEDKKFEISYRAALGICIAGVFIVLAMPFIARQRLAQYSVPTETAPSSPATPANAAVPPSTSRTVKLVTTDKYFSGAEVMIKDSDNNGTGYHFNPVEGSVSYDLSLGNVGSADLRLTVRFSLDAAVYNIILPPLYPGDVLRLETFAKNGQTWPRVVLNGHNFDPI